MPAPQLREAPADEPATAPVGDRRHDCAIRGYAPKLAAARGIEHDGTSPVSEPRCRHRHGTWQQARQQQQGAEESHTGSTVLRRRKSLLGIELAGEPAMLETYNIIKRYDDRISEQGPGRPSETGAASGMPRSCFGTVRRLSVRSQVTDETCERG